MYQCARNDFTVISREDIPIRWLGRPLEVHCEPDPSTDTVICDAEAFQVGLLGCVDLYEWARSWQVEAETCQKLATVDAASWAELIKKCEEQNARLKNQNVIWGASGAAIMGVVAVLLSLFA